MFKLSVNYFPRRKRDLENVLNKLRKAFVNEPAVNSV